MADAMTQYKLIVLYMLEQVDFPLGNTQLTAFFLEKEYASYFSLQQTLSDLASDGLVRAESTHNNTLYRATAAGREILSAFPDKVSDAIKAEARAYLKEHQMDLKDGVHLPADFFEIADNYCLVRCQIKDGDIPLVDLSIKANNRKQAEAICNNWKRQNEEVYGYLMDLLLR